MCILALTGCSTLPIHKKDTGMFDSYDDFKPGPKGGVDLVWARADITTKEQLEKVLAGYDSIMIDRAWLLIDDNTNYDNLSADDIEMIGEYLVQRIAQRAKQRFDIVEKPGGKTLRLSLALTNVATPNPILAVTSSLLPVGIGISTISKVVTGEHTNVGSATIELSLSDANTGEGIIAAIDRKSGNKDLGTIIDSTDDAKDAINWWVERLGHTFKAQQ